MIARGRRAVIAGVATTDYPNHPDADRARPPRHRRRPCAGRCRARRGTTSTASPPSGSSRCTPAAVRVLRASIPTYLDETNIGGASFEVLVEHAAARRRDRRTPRSCSSRYGSVQLSQMGRRLGTGGRTGSADRSGRGRRDLGQHARRQLRARRGDPAHARVRHDAGATRRDRGDDARPRDSSTRSRNTATRSRSTTSCRRVWSPTRCTCSTAASSPTAAPRASSRPRSGPAICRSLRRTCSALRMR